MFQKCQVRGVLPFQAFPIQSICCTIQGIKTLKLPNKHPNPINIHTLHPYVHNHLLQVSQDNSGQEQTPTETNRHQTTPTDGPRHPKRLFKDAWRLLFTLNCFPGVCWCLLVSDGIFQCPMLSRAVRRVSEEPLKGYLRVVYGLVYGLSSSEGASECSGHFWCSLLCIGKSLKGKIPHTWHFSNIKIPKPPFISSLKIIGFLHFWKFWGPSEENYNLQSLWITLYLCIVFVFCDISTLCYP